MRFSLEPLLPLTLAAALLAACGDEPPVVATVKVGASEIVLPYGRFVDFDLAWRARGPLTGREGPLHVFVHLRDESGSVVRTFDFAWPGSWRQGERLETRVILHQSTMGPPLDPGGYGLTLGIYDGVGRRWPLDAGGELVDRHEYRVAEVRVPAESSAEPMFQFSPEWLEVEPGRDRQVLARRWLSGAGQLRISGLEGPGELWLRLMVASPDERQELVLGEGASQPGALVRTDCGEVEARLAGFGSHDLVLPITPGGEAEACSVDVTPNFYLLQLDSGERRTVSLDGLAWSDGPSRRSLDVGS